MKLELFRRKSLEILRTRKYKGVKYMDDDSIIAFYDTEISKYIYELNDLDYVDNL